MRRWDEWAWPSFRTDCRRVFECMDPAEELNHSDEIQREAENQARYEEALRAFQANGSTPYQGGLSHADVFAYGVMARTKAVKPYLEAGAVGALSFPLVGTVGGAFSFFSGGAGLTTLNVQGRHTLTLFRAVRPGELTQLANSGGVFANPYGVEIKYFATNLQGAARYARLAGTRFKDGPYTIVRTSADMRTLGSELMLTVDGGISTVVLPGHLLPTLSPATVLNYIPLLF